MRRVLVRIPIRRTPPRPLHMRATSPGVFRFAQAPNVEPVHGRNCICHQCVRTEEAPMGRRA